jgi:Fe-S oxidoreductase
MLHMVETICFTVLLILTVYGFFSPLYLRYRLVNLGQPANRFDQPFKRVKDALVSFFFLGCSVKKERVVTGLVHFFFLYGSLTFDTVSLNHILEGYKEGLNIFGHGWLRHVHSAWADVFGIMVLAAVLYFVIRRYVVKIKSYTYPSRESIYIYLLLVTVTLTYFLYEGALIAYNPDHAYSAFASKVVAGWMSAVLPANMTVVKINWWLHILNVFVFVLYVPRSKYLHMIAGPVNIAFQEYRSKGIIKPLDLENESAESFGVVDFKDMTWRDLFDGFACIECGRCDDYCPANQTGKPLSPKNLIINLKKDVLENGRALLKNNENALDPLMERVYSPDEIWTCTSCGACMYVCPVKNEHLPKIIGLRQSLTLMEAKFPSELSQFYKGMETNSNPWGFGSSTRADWTEGLNLKLMSQDPEVDVLFWVGCAGAFDERGKKVTYALLKILKEAGVNFGILGEEENCCGDHARRLGNEYLFQMTAQQNIEVLQRYNVKKMLVTCPHGYHAFKHEYPQLAAHMGIDNWGIEVVHHTEFIAELIKNGKLNPGPGNEYSVTFHDPCYLGRHNGVFNPPREVLSQTGGKIVEMKKHHNHSFCCGAGGGLMWTEEHLGTRVNHMRTDQALETGAKTICTACPWCMTMMEDGIKDRGKDEEYAVKDIAEIVAESL